MRQVSICVVILSIIVACTILSIASDSVPDIDLDLLDPEALAAIQAEEGAGTREQILAKLVSVLRALSRNNNGAGSTGSGGGGLGMGNNNGGSSDVNFDYGRLGLSKRQIRYHQCYFNPISCFRRRK